ncbi:MAG: hypothetical protein LBG67_00980 [Campylobacteraceae bacterium]|jgi:hypothetical protein|nr:hypothetical protein [Campylobacteraceae bacterium]
MKVTKKDVLNALEEFKKSNKSRLRKDIYEFLNKKFGTSVRCYNYKITDDKAKVSLEDESEMKYVASKFANA